MLADLRYALRQLKRSPGFAFIAILTLALGIGANTAIFSIADAVLLRPLPYPYAERLVMIWDQLWNIGVHDLPVSLANYEAYRADSRVFEAAAIYREDTRNLTGAGAAERVTVRSFSPGLLEMLGAHLSAGRTFTADDWDPQHNNVAILGRSLFARRFASNPSIIGQTIRIDDHLFTVVGVMAPDREETDVWTPLPPVTDPHAWQFRLLARLRSGVSVEVAQASVAASARHVEEIAHPYRGPNGEDPGYHAAVVSLRQQIMGDYRAGTWILFAAVGLVLLISCVNVANLLVARATARKKETAMRRALGASSCRLIRQWMTEAAVLVFLGAITGAGASYAGVSVLRAFSPVDWPAVAHIEVDFRALLFTFGVSCLVCLLFGLAPVLTAIRMNWGVRGSLPHRRASSALVTVEVALALTLLVGAALLAKSFARLHAIDPGFHPDHLLTMRIQLSGPGYENVRRRAAYYAELQDRLRMLPGVGSVSTVGWLPVARVGADTAGGNPFSIEGRAWNSNGPVPQIAHTAAAGPDYFRTMQIPLLAGRTFTNADTPDSPSVAIVNQTLARGFFPSGDAIGHRILLGAPHPGARWMTIVGIIGDVRTGALDQPPVPQFYWPASQDAPRSVAIVLRTAGDPIEMAREATGIVRMIDPDQPVYDVSSMRQRVDKSLGQPRFETLLLGFFAAAALSLSVIGIYGVVSHATTRRMREIGIRMALGADSPKVIAWVLADGLRPVLLGIFLGLAGAAALTRFLSSALYLVTPHDPWMFACAVLALAGIAAAACLVPARRAALIDPMDALREE